MDLGDFGLSVLAGMIATLILGATGYKIINKIKQTNKINKSFNTNTTTTNTFNDSSQQNNAEQITINQSIKNKDD